MSIDESKGQKRACLGEDLERENLRVLRSNVQRQTQEIATLTTLFEQEQQRHRKDLEASEANKEIAVELANTYARAVRTQTVNIVSEMIDKFLAASLNNGILPDLLSKIVRDSGLVDDAWYRTSYQDIEAAGFDPSSHYVLFGAREKRPPNSDIDSLFKNRGFHEWMQANGQVKQQ